MYRSQGVNIADKHFETVIRKMMCKVQITRSGDSDLLPGELVDELELRKINEDLKEEDKEIATASKVLLGITKAALSTESYLSAASFQHTIKVLAGAAIEGQLDPLHGLKENVIIGKLIPAGTGFHAYQDREAVAPPVTLEAQGALDLDETQRPRRLREYAERAITRRTIGKRSAGSLTGPAFSFSLNCCYGRDAKARYSGRSRCPSLPSKRG